MSNALAFLGRDMAVDLGTANTLVYVRGRGIVLNEPSVVALNTNTGQIVAVGVEAKRMIGRTPGNIVAIRPLKDGVIADFDVTERMLRYFIQKVHKRSHLAKPRIVVAVPSGITGVEQSAVKEAGHQAGARRVYIIEEPMAAAIGAGLPVNEPTGNMVVDIGGGTTEVAVISLGGIVTSQSIRVGGDELDQAIITFGKKEYSLMLGERTAEEIKMALGSAFPSADEPNAEIRGRDLVSGLPKTIVISAEEIRRAIEEPLDAIVDAVKTTLDKCPPELAGDVMDRGIVLTGGGALLRGLDESSGRRRACRSTSPTTRSTPWRSVPANVSRTLTRCARFWYLSRGADQPEQHLINRGGAAPPRRGRGDLVHDSRRTRLILAVLLVAAVVLITADYRDGSSVPLRGLRGRRFGVRRRGARGQRRDQAGHRALALGRGVGRQRPGRRAAEEVIRLRAELSKEQLSKAEYRQLSQLLQLSGRGGYRIVAATVIAIGQGYGQTVTLDAGSKDGIRPQETVMDGQGLVGTVTAVNRADLHGAAGHRCHLRGRRDGSRAAARSAG